MNDFPAGFVCGLAVATAAAVFFEVARRVMWARRVRETVDAFRPVDDDLPLPVSYVRSPTLRGPGPPLVADPQEEKTPRWDSAVAEARARRLDELARLHEPRVQGEAAPTIQTGVPAFRDDDEAKTPPMRPLPRHPGRRP